MCHFHFIYPEGEAYAATTMEPHQEWPFFYGGAAAWVLQGYFRLRGRLPGTVTIGSTPMPDAINVSDAHILRRVRKRVALDRHFIVNILNDKPDYIDADLRVVQNRNQVRSLRDVWIPHWPQPGLLPRTPSTRQRPLLAFFGRPRYGLGSVFRRDVGREVEALGYDYREIPAAHWNDYRDVDVAVGIRSFGSHAYDHKPPSKLVNAWLAGVPFIGGADSAYTQIGTPNDDFLRVTTRQQFLEALERLRGDDLYDSLVAAGAEAARQYSVEAQINRWITALADKAYQRFNVWDQAGKPRVQRRSDWQVRLQIWNTRIGRRIGRF